MEKIKLEVNGMTCVNCAGTVTKSLQQFGANNIHVNYSTNEAEFELESTDLTPEIVKELNKLGYPTALPGASITTPFYKKIEFLLLFSAVFTLPLMVHMFVNEAHVLNNAFMQLALCLPVFTVGVLYFGKSSFNALKLGTTNMDVLIFLGSTAAFGYSLIGVYQQMNGLHSHNFLFFETAASIITLVLLGNFIEHKAVQKTTSSVEALVNLVPAKAKKIELENGVQKIVEVAVNQLNPGNVIQINQGDRIPTDGKIVKGTGLVNQAMLTGESEPVTVHPKAEVFGGTVLVQGNLMVRVTKPNDQTVLAGIINLVKNAQRNPADIQKLADKISAIFVPAVVAVSIVTFLVNFFVVDVAIQQSFLRAIAVLVISCPCAMGLATPTAIMVGVGKAAKLGILFKGAQTMETFAKTENLVFDKTGTLTTGYFTLIGVHPKNNYPTSTIYSLIAGLEQHSNHPIALSLLAQLKDVVSTPATFDSVSEKIGEGVEGTYNDKRYSIGKNKGYDGPKTSLELRENNEVIATIELEDEVKPQAKELIQRLHNVGVNPIVLSGDTSTKVTALANELGVNNFKANCSPQDKLAEIEALKSNGITAMFGDGVNDAPALTKAHIGVSMANATEIAITSANVVLLGDAHLKKLSTALAISRDTLTTIKQNLFWAFAYNLVAIPIAAAGFLHPMVAAAAMAFSDVVVIGNSIRLHFKKVQQPLS